MKPKPIEINSAGEIVNGHQRAKAARDLGIPGIPVDISDKEQLPVDRGGALASELAELRKQLHAHFNLLPVIHKPGAELVKLVDDLFDRLSAQLRQVSST